MSADTRPPADLLAEYEAWANGELSEISDEAMLAGSPKFRAVARAMLADNGGDEDAMRRDLRAAYQRWIEVGK